jgi:hypothetical protein
MDYLIEKLKEPSTWKGLVWIVTAFGVVLSPEQKEAIAGLGMAVAGLIGVFVEKGNAHTKEEIASIAKSEYNKNLINNAKGKKNAKPKKSVASSDSDNFFDDGDGTD